MQTIKAGTKVQMLDQYAETARIVRWTDVNGPVKNDVRGMKGWHVVRFDTGGKLVVHETAFRIIDNRY